MRNLRIVRIVLALAVFACANLFFFGLAEFAAPLFRLQLLPAVLSANVLAIVAVLSATVLFGRVYCSIVCPMGVFQDGIVRLARLCRRNRPMRKRMFPAPPRFVRYVALAASVALIAFGFVSFGALLDGYSLYGRIATQVFKPAYSLALNLVAVLQANAGHPYAIREEVFVRGSCALMVSVAGVVGIGALVWWRGRLFCNTLCPVGALLAIAAKRPAVRIAIDPDACARCGLCASVCRCGAIDHVDGRVDDSSCVRCLDCLAACRKGAIGLSSGWRQGGKRK